MNYGLKNTRKTYFKGLKHLNRQVLGEMKQEIDKEWLSKSVAPIKNKLSNMKDAYKKSKR